MEILLDTNTLYYLCGISQGNCNLDKIRMKIKNAECVYISNVTVYEILNKYIDEVEKVRMILDFISSNRIKVIKDCNLPFYSIDFYHFKNMTRIDLKKLYKRYMPIKIEFEARITAIILVDIFIIYSMIEIKNSDKLLYDFHYNSLRLIYELVRDISLKYFQIEYVNGYNSKNCEDHIRKSLNFSLEHFISEYKPKILEVLNATQKSDLLTLAEKCDYTNIDLQIEMLRKKVNKKPTAMKFIESFVRDYKRQKGYETFLNEFDKINSYFFHSTLSGYGLQNYLKEIIHNCITKGCSFLKNDIADALIINQINNNRFLITFDCKMKKFLEAHASINEGCSKSFTISKNCL